MGNYELTTPDLLILLGEQLHLLDFSISNFSRHDTIEKYENKVLGNPFTAKISTEIEAKRIAIILRVLVHDTGHSTSLLKHLEIKDKVEFIDSSAPNDGKLHSMTGMHGVRGSIIPQQYFGLLAKINSQDSLIAVPLFKQHLPEWYQSYKKISFDDWWKAIIININGITFSREELVLASVNKDGGAHVDKNLKQQYHVIKTTPLSLNIKGIQTDFERNVVYASIAQIGWELLNSINEPLDI